MQSKKGFTSVIMLVIAVIILVIAVVLYMFLNGDQNVISNVFNYNQESQIQEEPAEVSDSSDTDTMEAELKATTVNDPSSDFAELDNDLQSL